MSTSNVRQALAARLGRAKGGTTPEQDLISPRGGHFYLAAGGDRNGSGSLSVNGL